MRTDTILKAIKDYRLKASVAKVAAAEGLSLGEAVVFCVKKVVLPSRGEARNSFRPQGGATVAA